MSAKKGKSAMQGVKLKIALGLPVGALINCADNSGAKNIFIKDCSKESSSLFNNRLQSCFGIGDDGLMYSKKRGNQNKKKSYACIL